MRITLVLLLSFLSITSLSPAADRDGRSPLPAIDNLRLVGHNGFTAAHLMDVELAGDRAYVSSGWPNGLETYDITNPARPILLDAQGPPAWGARAYGDRLFVFSRERGFKIYDIGGSTPFPLGGHDPVNGDVLYENGVLAGGVLYVAAHQMGLYSFDVSNASSPVLLDSIPLAVSACWDVEASSSHLFVANGRLGLSVVELTSPPVEVAVLPLPGLANHIVLDGGVAILSLGPDGIASVDISSPAAPAVMDVAPTAGNASGSGIWNHLVAVGSWSSLEVFDVSDPYDISVSAWDNTYTWAMGADIQASGAEGRVAVGDWRGMSTYATAPDGGPDIDVSPMRLDFGEVAALEEITVDVRNTGTADLDVTVSGVPSGITVAPMTFSVSAGSSQPVLVSAAGTGTVKSTISYDSNDPDEGSVRQYVYKNNASFPQVDSEAPDFTLRDLDGFWHTLSDYRGSVVHIEFGGLW